MLMIMMKILILENARAALYIVVGWSEVAITILTQITMTRRIKITITIQITIPIRIIVIVAIIIF